MLQLCCAEGTKSARLSHCKETASADGKGACRSLRPPLHVGYCVHAGSLKWRGQVDVRRDETKPKAQEESPHKKPSLKEGQNGRKPNATRRETKPTASGRKRAAKRQEKPSLRWSQTEQNRDSTVPSHSDLVALGVHFAPWRCKMATEWRFQN